MSKKSSTENNTPVRLPRLSSQISEGDLMEINMSQDDRDEIIWSEKDESIHQQQPQKDIDNNNKENEATKKRRKRLMKFDSTENEKRQRSKKKSSKEVPKENKEPKYPIRKARAASKRRI